MSATSVLVAENCEEKIYKLRSSILRVFSNVPSVEGKEDGYNAKGK